MFNISDYLKKVKNQQSVKSEFKDFIVFLLKNNFFIDIKRDDISLRFNVLYLNISQIQKNEIFLNKNEIIKKISEKFHNIAVKDIR